MDLQEKVSFPFGKAHLLVALTALLEQAGRPEAILTDRDTIFFGPATPPRGLTP